MLHAHPPFQQPPNTPHTVVTAQLSSRIAHLETACTEIQTLLQQHTAQLTDLRIEMIGVREEISLLRKEMSEQVEEGKDEGKEEDDKGGVKKEENYLAHADMESKTPIFLPNASEWTIACPGLNCNRLVSLPSDPKKVPLCKHSSRAELAKVAELASRVALKEIEEEQAKYRRQARLAGNRSWRRGVKMPKMQTKVQVKKEGDKKVPRRELESVCMEQVDQPRKTSKEIMAERNAAMRAGAGAGQYADTSNSAMSRYETNSPPIMNQPENEAELLSMRRGSPVISLLEKSLQNDSRRNRPRRSNSYNSLFVVKVETEQDEPRTLARGRDDMSRRDRRSRNGVRVLFPEKTRTESRSTRGRRGRDSGFAPAISPAIRRRRTYPLHRKSPDTAPAAHRCVIQPRCVEVNSVAVAREHSNPSATFHGHLSNARTTKATIAQNLNKDDIREEGQEDDTHNQQHPQSTSQPPSDPHPQPSARSR